METSYQSIALGEGRILESTSQFITQENLYSESFNFEEKEMAFPG